MSSTVAGIFETMAYGPAPESKAPALEDREDFRALARRLGKVKGNSARGGPGLRH